MSAAPEPTPRRSLVERARAPASRSVAVSLFTVVGFLVLYLLVPLEDEGWPVGALAGLVAIVAIIPITVRRARGIRRSDHPVSEAVEAVSLVASAVIFGFAATYYVIANTSGQIPGIDTKVDSLYFTMTTMATVGFGDIVPTGQGARALVTFQILVNLTLVGSAIRLISSVATERRRRQVDPNRS